MPKLNELSSETMIKKLFSRFVDCDNGVETFGETSNKY